MTGFGKASAQNMDFSFEVSVRAVNGRFLDIKIYAPKVYAPIENEIRQVVAKHMMRGTVEVFINRKSFNGSESIHINTALAKKWLTNFNKMAKELGMGSLTDPSLLLNGPEFIQVEETSRISSQEKKMLMQTITEAVQGCGKVRESEGKALLKDIQGQLKTLGLITGQIKKLRKTIVSQMQERLQGRLQALKDNLSLDEQRLAQEVVIMLDKSDINEEVQRLDAHFAALKTLVASSGSIGKKLDFYAQELLREVNTIGSKSSNADLTQLVVEAKGSIEKYREQVQNVE